MNTQPEALRLADYMEKDPRYYDASEWEKEAATELRRLYDENQRMNQAGIQLSGEVILLEKQNAELLEALQEISLYVPRNDDTWVRNRARQAIAKATGEKI